jgi:hypothetical protein
VDQPFIAKQYETTIKVQQPITYTILPLIVAVLVGVLSIAAAVAPAVGGAILGFIGQFRLNVYFTKLDNYQLLFLLGTLSRFVPPAFLRRLNEPKEEKVETKEVEVEAKEVKTETKEASPAWHKSMKRMMKEMVFPK